MAAVNIDSPPGTILLEDIRHASKVVLNPVPTDDPNDPLNWSKFRKVVNFFIVSFYVLITFVLLDIGTVAYGPYEDIGISYNALNDAWALNYFGLAVGCIFFIPFVHKYGRRPVYIVSILIQFASTIWNAKVNNSANLLAAYTFSGLGGAISETIVQITIADLFFVHQRATATGVFILMQNMGAYLGPVAAGYIVVDEGWRWMWWWSAIILAINFVMVLFFYEETKYVPAIAGETVDSVPQTEEPAKGSSMTAASIEVKQAGSDDGHPTAGSSKPSVEQPQYKLKSYRERLAFWTPSRDISISWKDYFVQPFIVLFQFPGVFYAALTYGALLSWYSVLTTVESDALLYPPYNWDSSGIGLLQIAPFVGSFIGAAIGGPLNDYAIMWLAKRNNGVYEPEMRLWMSIPTIILCPMGLLIFGIGLAHGVSWVVLAIGWAINCVAMAMALDVALTYVTDCYQDIVGTALVAIVFARNGISIPIMFLVTPWVNNLGTQNCFISMAVLSFVFQLLPIPLLIWGKKARVMTADKYRGLAKKQPLHRST